MPTFRSKPRTITAEQYHTANGPTDHEGVCIGGPTCEAYPPQPEGRLPHLHTMHGGQPVRLKDGDWIVPEPDGIHYYPIDAAVMEKNYEPVDTEEAWPSPLNR